MSHPHPQAHPRNSKHHFSLMIMGGRLKVDFESHLKLDSFSKSYIYSERGNFAASFYNKNSISYIFWKYSIFLGGGLNEN